MLPPHKPQLPLHEHSRPQNIQVDDNGFITDSRFKTFGCGSAIASSSVVTEWIRGKSVDDVVKIKNSEIAKHLSLPPVKLHCSMLAEDAIKVGTGRFCRWGEGEGGGARVQRVGCRGGTTGGERPPAGVPCSCRPHSTAPHSKAAMQNHHLTGRRQGHQGQASGSCSSREASSCRGQGMSSAKAEPKRA